MGKIKKVTEPIAKLKQAVGSVWNKLFGSDDDKKAVPATARQPEVGQAVVADVGKISIRSTARLRRQLPTTILPGRRFITISQSTRPKAWMKRRWPEKSAA